MYSIDLSIHIILCVVDSDIFFDALFIYVWFHVQKKILADCCQRYGTPRKIHHVRISSTCYFILNYAVNIFCRNCFELYFPICMFFCKFVINITHNLSRCPFARILIISVIKFQHFIVGCFCFLASSVCFFPFGLSTSGNSDCCHHCCSQNQADDSFFLHY